MPAELLTDLSRATDANGNTLSGAQWFFYTTGTTTPQPSYTSSSLATPHAHPVVADAGGEFPAIYLNSNLLYRGVLKSASGVTLKDRDPINPTGGLSDFSGADGANLIGFSQDTEAYYGTAGGAPTFEQNFTYDDGPQNFTLRQPIAGYPWVFVNGVRLDDADFSTSGLTLSLVTPLIEPIDTLRIADFDFTTLPDNPSSPGTVAAKLQQFLNPLDDPFLAVGNGFTDDHDALEVADTRGPIIITANHRIASNLTITRDIMFMGNGRLTIDASVTVTFGGAVTAPERQIFYGTGNVAGLGISKVAWFAGDLIGVPSDSVARIQKAYNAAITRGRVEWPVGDLYSGGTSILAEKGQHSVGKGYQTSRLLWLTSVTNGIKHYNVEGPRVEGIGMDMSDANVLPTSGSGIEMGAGAGQGSVDSVRIQRAYVGAENVNCPGTLWTNTIIYDCKRFGKRVIGSDNVSDVGVFISAFSTPVDMSNTTGLSPGDSVVFSNGANGTFLFLTSSTRAHIVINDILPIVGNTASNGGAFNGTVTAIHTPHELGALRLENRCELYRGTNSTYAGGRFYLTITADSDVRGSRPYACRFTACDIDSAHEGASIEKCDDITFSNCYLFNRAGYAITLEGTSRRVNFHATTIIGSWLEAILVKTGVVGCGFVDGKIVGANRSNTGAPAVRIQAGARFRLTGNEISGPNGFGGTPAKPWIVASGAATGLRIGDNDTAGCTDPAGEDNSTGSSKLITADYQ